MTQKASTPFWKGKSGIFMGGILLVAAVIAFVSLDGYPPSDDESAGAIGAAKRYRAEQISDADVILQDAEIQALLQNDEFHKLIADESFQKAVKDNNFAGLMENEIARKFFFEAMYMRQMLDADMAHRLDKVDYGELSADQAYDRLVKVATDAKLGAPDLRRPDFATDAALAGMFEHELARRAVADFEYQKELVDGGFIMRLKKMEFSNMHPDAQLAALRQLPKDADFRVNYPRITAYVEDMAFAGLFEQNLMFRKIVDAEFAQWALDVHLAGKLREVAYANLRPELAYGNFQRVTRDMALGAPDRRIPEFASDAALAGMFEHNLARRALVDAKLMHELVEVDFAKRLQALKFANMNPEAQLAALQQLPRDADFLVKYPRITAYVEDQAFAGLFEQNLMFRKIVDAEFAKWALDVNLMGKLREVSFSNMRPELALASFDRAAADYALGADHRRMLDAVGDAEFAGLFEHDLARRALVDAKLMHELVEVNFTRRLQAMEFANMHPEAQLAALQKLPRDADFRVNYPRVTAYVEDAAFAGLFEQNLMFRKVVDAKFARWALDVNLMGKLREVNFANMHPEVAYGSYFAAATEHALASQYSPLDLMTDQKFKLAFMENKLMQRLPIDADFMKIIVETDAGYLVNPARLDGPAMDAQLLRRMVDDLGPAGDMN